MHACRGGGGLQRLQQRVDGTACAGVPSAARARGFLLAAALGGPTGNGPYSLQKALKQWGSPSDSEPGLDTLQPTYLAATCIWLLWLRLAVPRSPKALACISVWTDPWATGDTARSTRCCC